VLYEAARQRRKGVRPNQSVPEQTKKQKGLGS
jgi:hypothetical protein